MSHLPRNELASESQRSNTSVYSLDTAHYDDETTDRSPLLPPSTPSYGATFPRSPALQSPSRLIFNATVKMGCIFIVSTALLGGTLYLALPQLEEVDRPLLKIPKSFAELQALNHLLKKYRDIYPYRIVICYVTTYLFLQAFSLPGSMYLSILGGAVWGVARALPLACCCVATGATLCYLISAALGPALLTLPKLQRHVEKWSAKIRDNKENMISFLIVLRIAPFPPHWVVNVICPHVGIGIIPFWISTALGILGVSVIHTTIGGGLDDMTSAADFHLISWRNFFGLAAIVIGVMIPVGLRYWFRREVASVVEAEASESLADGVGEDQVIAVGPPPAGKFTKDRPLLTRDNTDQPYSSGEEDEDEDVILEAGPSLDLNDKDAGKGRQIVKDSELLIVLDSSSTPSSSSSLRQ